MTQVESILSELDSHPSGLTSKQLHERLRLPANSVHTLLWEMKRKGQVARIGGSRKSYIYTITQKGREGLPQNRKDPMTRLAEALSGEPAGEAAVSEILKLLQYKEDYQLLQRFINRLAEEGTSPLGMLTPEDVKVLEDHAMRFLGVDPDLYAQQVNDFKWLFQTI